MKIKFVAKLLALLSLLSLVFAGVTQADTRQFNNSYYSFGTNGFFLRLDSPQNPNLTSNIIDNVHFTLYWYDPKKTRLTENDPYYYGDVVNDDKVIVTYTSKLGTFSPYNVGPGVYEIHNFDTQLNSTKTGYKLSLTIKPKDTKDKTSSNYYGASDKVDIQFNYFQSDTPGNSFTSMLNNGQLKMFNNSLLLNFTKDAYVSDANGVPLDDQNLAVHVDNPPSNTDYFIFLSNAYRIEDTNGTSCQPSQSGKITLSYNDNVDQAAAANNVSIAHYKDGKWTAIGSTVDSRQKKVTADIDDFGTYAVVMEYRTYNMDHVPNWARPYVVELSNNKIIQPEVFSGDKAMIDNVTRPITRFQFISLIARAKGLQPAQNRGYFVDMPQFAYGPNQLGYDGAGYVMSAVVNGIVKGKVSRTGGNMIDPESPITREEASVMISQALGLKVDTYDKLAKTKATLLKTFKDGKTISDWAAPYVQAVYSKKIMQGNQGRFNPKNKLSVAEASALVYNMMGNIKTPTNRMNASSSTARMGF